METTMSQNKSRWERMVESASASVDSLAATLWELGNAEKFAEQEAIMRAIQDKLGWVMAQEVDDRYVHLVRKFG